MLNYRVSAVNNLCEISSFIEHAKINAELSRKINASLHCAFVGRNNHKVIFINLKIINVVYDGFNHLVCGHNILKRFVRNCVLNSLIVRIEGDDIFNTEVYKLLQSHCAVERFAA